MKTVFAPIFLILILTSCAEDKVVKYAKLEDAVTDGAVARGWVPDFLPADAVEIYESHNVDVGQVALTFSAKNTEFLKLFRAIEKAGGAEAKKTLESVDFPASDFSGGSASYYYRCGASGVGLLALNNDDHRFYYYEPLIEDAWLERCKSP